MSVNHITADTKKFDVYNIRKHFPILGQYVNGKPLIYFDNAATTQKPLAVINAINDYYTGFNANIHRGVHTMADQATNAFEDTRNTVKEFLNAESTDQIIFTYGTTDSINLIAQTYGKRFVGKGDEIIISGLEHHSNIVPWQMLCKELGANLKVIPVLENGELDIEVYTDLLGPKTKIVSVGHVSNALGTINPVKKIISMAHNTGAIVFLDGAQAAAHLDLDVQLLDCDFYAFSAHKAYGPTGVGILYGKKEFLDQMPPYRGGGEMIKEVTFNNTTYNDPPYKFEAGTPNIADIIALKSALEFITSYSKKEILNHEKSLLELATKSINSFDRIKIIGESSKKISILSFLINGLHHFDAGMLLDAMGIAVRTGHHCAQPLMHRFGIDGTIRASLTLYNTKEEVTKFIEAIDGILKKL